MSSKDGDNGLNTDRSNRIRIESDRVSYEESWLNIEIRTSSHQPELLQGLEQWLQLNLISQAQVKKLARNYLSCALPEPEVTKPITRVLIEPELVVKAPANVMTRIWQGFLDELSIRWLLFLGIFLVIVSSGVLAASQWQNFPSFGQYLILLVYTLGFWGIGFWTSKQDLKLTSQTLNAIATLLIPINFWAISYLGLGRSIVDWTVIAIAMVVTATIVIFKKKQPLFSIPFWLLGCLHLGWNIDLVPLLSIYSGITIISFIYYRFLSLRYSTNLLFLLAAWLLLLARRLVGEIYLAPYYCLAIAILAWLLATVCLARSKSKHDAVNESIITNDLFNQVCQAFSIILFIATGLRSIVAGVLDSPWFFYQTVGIGALGIHLFYQRLTSYWRKRDLTAIFSIGLLTIYISKELIPESFRTQAIDFAVTASKTEYFPESIFGITLFPYLILFVLVASWLYRRQKPQLALYTEYLTLILGVVLTCLSLSNPLWRSLNLICSTLTLSYVTKIRQPIRGSLIYLTHSLGLITIVQGISIFPNISLPVWGSILIALVVVEWSIYLRQTKYRLDSAALIWQSCWYFGLSLSVISYGFFLKAFSQTPIDWGLIWLVVPAMLTAIAKHTKILRQKRLATSLSCIALIIAQLLLFQFETRFIGLTVATGLMFINAFNLRHIVVTIIHLGFGLCWLANLLNIFIDGWNWLLIGAITMLGLYRLRLYLQQVVNTPKFDYISQRQARGILGVGVETKNFKSIDKYITAVDYWAIAIGMVETALLSIIYLIRVNFEFQYLLTTALIIGAIIWRYRQPRNWTICTLVWLTELLVIGFVNLIDGSSLAIATANIIVGSLALVTLKQISKSNSGWRELISYVPVIYAMWAILWRLPYYNALTGLLTLGAAIILLNTKVNERANMAIDYLAYACISVGIYELVIYQIRLLGGSIADNLTVLALTTAAIAFSYRFIAWCDRQRTRIIFIAHLHWAVASIFKIIAAGVALENTATLTWISIATSFCLGAYAVIQGKDSILNSFKNDWWVYVGTVEITATLIYSRLIIDRLSLFDPWRVVFTCAIALLIYQIPWQNIGWRVTPWRRIASIIPAVMALAIAEDISYLNLLVTALFYFRIARVQRNIRWSYISLGFIDWGIVRSWQYALDFIWIPVAIGLSILYIAQFDPYFQSRRHRHYFRVLGCSVICIATLFYSSAIISGVLAFGFIFLGLGLKIRAFLFTGTITLVFSVIYQLIILVMTYSFLKWIIGLFAGIGSIAIAARFERQRSLLNSQLKNYGDRLQNWQ